MGSGHRPRTIGAPGDRAKTTPRGLGLPPGHTSIHGIPPPPVPYLRSAMGAGSANPSGRPNVPPPPPYPPPPQHQPFYYGMVPQGPSSFEYQPGMTPVARLYAYGYGPPQPQPMYPGYPQAVPYPGGQLVPAGPEALGARSWPQRPFGSPSDPKISGYDHSLRRSPRTPRAGVRREARPGPTSEATPVAEMSNAAGLPVRPGRPDCKHYLSHGWCSYGRVCKYNHSDVPAPQAPPQPPPPRPFGHGQNGLGLSPAPWQGVGMQYPVYGWPMAQVPVATDPGVYGPGWGYPPSPIVYYPPAGPPPGKPAKRQTQSANFSARSSDSAASTSSRMVDPLPDSTSESKER